MQWEAEVQAVAIVNTLSQALGGGQAGKPADKPVERVSADALLGSMGISLG